VKAGAVVATLKDTQTNYDLRLAQAENALTIQNAGIATTRINMESAVDNARIAYERAKQAYETLTGKNALQYDTVVNANEKTLK
jgi:multidrug resistance efflux pump